MPAIGDGQHGPDTVEEIVQDSTSFIFQKESYSREGSGRLLTPWPGDEPVAIGEPHRKLGVGAKIVGGQLHSSPELIEFQHKLAGLILARSYHQAEARPPIDALMEP